MPAPLPAPLALGTSTSSSGFADGLGRRSLAFDREEGTMLERLAVRPELAAFERMLRERIDRLAALEDERIARPRTLERDADGALVVVSEFVPGSRLSDLLDTSSDLGHVPGVDAAFGFLLDVLPALCGMHAGAGFAHGTISPSRVVITPAGQVVLLDAIYGGALSHLRYGRHKLWSDFGVAAPASAGAPRLEVAADITQVALASVMLVLGRPIAAGEYPDHLPALLSEVGEVARIRSTNAFAEGVLTFFHRALTLPGTRPFSAADDALIEVRELAEELGVHVCRRALVDFIEQMESGTAPSALEADEATSTDEDELLDEIAGYGLPAEPAAGDDLALEGEAGPDLESGVDAEIDLESLVEEPLYDLNEVTEIEVAAEDVSLDDPALLAWQEPASEPVVVQTPAELDAAFEIDAPAVVRAPEPPPAPVPVPTPALPSEAPAAEHADTASADDDTDGVESEAEATPSVRSRRARRTRSARARKDRLRSAAHPSQLITTAPAIDEIAPAPAPAPAPVEPAKPWLVPPDRAAAFQEPLPPPQSAPPPAPLPMPAPPAFAMPAPPPVYQPQVVAPPAPPRAVMPMPIGVPAPTSGTAPVWPQPPSASVADLVKPQLAPVKLKEAARKRRGTVAPPAAIEKPVAAAAPTFEPVASGGFPWKAVAAVAIVALTVLGGARAYLGGTPAAPAVDGDARTATAAVKPAPATPPPPVAANAARLEIETQPAGAHVTIDGKPAGDSPLTLDTIPPGRHTVVFTSSSGTVKKTVRLEAGRTTKLDVPIFSGWVGIFAPFVLEVSEGGRTIGTTEEPRLMLSAGRHVLTLANADLGYHSVQTVDIEPGEIRTVSLDPRGSVNLNALPWAEVWLDGKKLGDTPIANLELPLGVREVTFRHPQLGERRATVTVRSGAPAAVSVDMTK